MKPKINIGVDLMGGDNPPLHLLQALKDAAFDSSVELTVIGTSQFQSASPFPYVIARDAIGMEDNPLVALRKKRDASMLVGLRLLKEKKIDALVSSGNTGALVSGSKMVLSTLPHILRPALLALMPTKKKAVAVLDVGANVQIKSTHLIQFAWMVAAYLKSRGEALPTIGLLNIGSEPLKGTSELRLAYHHLQHLPHPPFKFAGNIEGKSVFDGDVDALITDGFTGNIFLKTAEGMANLILDRISTTLPKESRELLSLQDLQRHLHYAEYPGALLIGVRGIVIKCHGYSTLQAFVNGVREAIRLVAVDFLSHFQSEMSKQIF